MVTRVGVEFPSGPFCPTAWKGIAAILHLSPRQVAVAACVLSDYSKGDIAQRLRLSTHTVQRHLERLYERLHVRSRCQLVSAVFVAYIRWDRKSGRSGSCEPSTRTRQAEEAKSNGDKCVLLRDD